MRPRGDTLLCGESVRYRVDAKDSGFQSEDSYKIKPKFDKKIFKKFFE